MSNILQEQSCSSERATEGYLQKKSRSLFGGWQNRYFITFINKIVYFLDSDEKDKRGQIDIQRITEINCIKDLQFQLIIPSRKYQLRAKSKEQRDQWVSKLNKLRRQKKNQSPETKQTKSTDRVRSKQKKILKKNSHFKDYCEHIQSIISMTQISNLLNQYQREEIQSRMITLKSQSGLYWAISCKPLEIITNDDKIFNRQLIKPYDYNTLYVIRDQKILQYCRCANIINVSPQPSQIFIQFKSDKLLKMSIQTEDIEMIKVIKFNKLLKRMIEIGKEYHNSMDITLNKNIDFMLKLYEENKKASSSLILKQYKSLMSKNYSDERNSIDNVFERLQSLNLYLIDLYNACIVKRPPTKDFFKFVCKIQQPHTYQFLQQSWNNNYQKFLIEDIGRFSQCVASYYTTVKSVVQDSRLATGVTTLFGIFLRKKQEKIYELLCSHGQKYRLTELNTILRNSSNMIILEKLSELINQLKNRTQNQQNFILICEFLKNFVQYFCQIKTKNLSQMELDALLANCNDIDCFTFEDLPKIQKKMISNKYSNTIYHKLCGNHIDLAISQLKQNFIEKIFLTMFGTINKKLLAKNLGEIDLGQISAAIQSKISEIKDYVTDRIRMNIEQKTLDQVCYFYYNCIVKFPNTGNFSATEIAQKIVNDVKRIQSTFIKLLPKDKVLFQVQDLLNLSSFIICKQEDVIMNLKDIRDNFGASFNQVSLKCLINLRDGSWQSKKSLLQECMQCLKSASGYSPEQIIEYHSRESFMGNWRHTRSRKSTTQIQIGHKRAMDLQLAQIKKKITAGYMKKKKLSKAIPSLYYDCFLILKFGKLYQYDREDSQHPNSILNISQLIRCHILPQDQKTIFMECPEGSYHFKAHNVEESHHWLRKILQQKSDQSGKLKNIENEALFKDYFDNQPSSYKKLSCIDKKKSNRPNKQKTGCNKCSFGLFF